MAQGNNLAPRFNSAATLGCCAIVVSGIALAFISAAAPLASIALGGVVVGGLIIGAKGLSPLLTRPEGFAFHDD